jgi:predicted dehydrogenase
LKKVNLGIIGLGSQGKIHLRNCLRLKDVNVLGVADVSKKALSYAKKIGVKKVYKNYEDLLKNEQLDAAVISLPNFLHLEGAITTAEAGKDIFLEKPLARNVEEGKRIVSYVRKNGVKLMVGFDLRFNPIVREIYKKIKDGFFGEIQSVVATNVSSGPFTSRSTKVGPVPVPSWWFNEKSVGGGVLLDLGSHMIDLLTWYFGEVSYLESYLGYMLNMDIEDVATCNLKFKDGPFATINVGWFSKDFMQSIQICGTAKNLWIPISPTSALVKVWRDFKRKIGWYNYDPYYSELKYFVQCLQKDEKPIPSEEDGLKCLRLVSLAYEKTQKRFQKQVEEV